MSVAELIRERTSRPARLILREWVKEFIEDKDEVTTEGLVEAAYRRFAHDDEFVEAILADGIALLVPTIANDVWGASRRMVSVSSGSVSREALEVRTNRFASMFENAGDGKHVSLLAMKRPQLRVAIEERAADVDGRIRTLGFLKDVESGLKNDKQTVGEKFTESQLESIWNKHNS